MTGVETDERVKRHVERWADRVSRRMRAHDPEHRPVWDRGKFLEELYADVPDLPPADAVALTDRFDRAVREARGSSARFDRSIADS